MPSCVVVSLCPVVQLSAGDGWRLEAGGDRRETRFELLTKIPQTIL